MATKEDLSLEIVDTQKLIEEQKLTAKRNWLNNDVAKDYVDALKEKRLKFLTEASNLSVNAPPDISQIIRNLIQAHTIQQTIDTLLKL